MRFFRVACIVVAISLILISTLRLGNMVYLFSDDLIGYAKDLGGLSTDSLYFLQTLGLALLCFYVAHRIKEQER